MKNAMCGLVAAFFAVGLCPIALAQSQSPSLGDYGRTLRRNKPSNTTPVRAYDNDNLPSTDSVRVVGNLTKSAGDADKTAASSSDATQDNSDQQTHAGEIKIDQSPSERQKAYAYWKKRINKQGDKVEQLALELNDLKQNAPLSVVVLHLWPDDQLYLQSIIEKQKALDQARADLSDLEDQARKAGVPSSFIGGDGNGASRESLAEGKKIYANVILQQQVRKAGTSSHENEADGDGKSAGQNNDTSLSSINGDPNQNEQTKGEIKLGQSPEARQKAYAHWQKRVQQREDRIDQLTRELDDLKRNVPTAVIMHLWPEDQLYLQIVADKQKTLEQAKGDLSELQEQARKSGVPSSFTQ